MHFEMKGERFSKHKDKSTNKGVAEIKQMCVSQVVTPNKS